MTANQMELERFELGIGDAFIGQLPETRVGAVDEFVVAEQLLDHVSSRLDWDAGYDSEGVHLWRRLPTRRSFQRGATA